MAFFRTRLDTRVSLIFKSLVGLGITVVAVSMMLYITDIIDRYTHSPHLQAAAIGLIIMAFAYLGWRMFDRM